MGSYRIGVLLGDDIGPEIVPQAVGVLAAAAEKAPDLKLEFVDMPIGKAAYEATGYSLPPGTLEKLAQLDGWILGPIGHAAYPKDNPNFTNPHPIIRRHFDLYANMRPALSIPGVKALHEGVDVLIVRENNEGMQPDRNMYKGSGEFMPTPDTALSTRVITRRGSERIARAAFEAARDKGKRRAARERPRVMIVHKRTVFKLTCGLFVDTAREVAAEYSDVDVEDMQVDSFALALTMNPQRFDTVVTTNMFGDILSDLAAGLVGGLGLAPGLNVGERRAMAQATPLFRHRCCLPGWAENIPTALPSRPRKKSTRPSIARSAKTSPAPATSAATPQPKISAAPSLPLFTLTSTALKTSALSLLERGDLGDNVARQRFLVDQLVDIRDVDHGLEIGFQDLFFKGMERHLL